MSDPASDDTTNSEVGVYKSPDSSLFPVEPEHGSSAPTPISRTLEFDVNGEAGEDDLTESAAMEDDEDGVCSQGAASEEGEDGVCSPREASEDDDPWPELGPGGSAPIPILDSITKAGDDETSIIKAAEDYLCSLLDELRLGLASAMSQGEPGLEPGPHLASSSMPLDGGNINSTSVAGYNAWFYDSFDFKPPHSFIGTEEDVKVPLVGDKEPISALAIQFQSAIPILQEKIKLLDEQYSALRRTRGDGNCFYRSFMFSYLEHILETQDRVEVERITASIERCKRTLQNLGYDELIYEDFFNEFIQQLESVLHGQETSISHEMLLARSRDAYYSDIAVKFFRFVTSGEIQRREDFFEPFIAGLEQTTVAEFCKQSVEPMGTESEHVHVIALSDALGVSVRVVYLDQSTNDMGTLALNHHDFIPDQYDTVPKAFGTSCGTTEITTSVASDEPQAFGTSCGTTEITTSVASDKPQAFGTSDQDGTIDDPTYVAIDMPKAFETSCGQDGTTQITTSVTSDTPKSFGNSGTENPTYVAIDMPKAFETSGQNDTTENTTSVARDAPKPFVTLLYRPGHYDILYSK